MLKGELARTLSMTDMLTGWSLTRSMRNNADKHVRAILDQAVKVIQLVA